MVTVNPLHPFVQNLIFKEVDRLDSKENGEILAIKYLGRALIAAVVGILVFALAVLGYNTYISVSKEKIEVQATNSNSMLLNE